jgi:hypothetical protein
MILTKEDIELRREIEELFLLAILRDMEKREQKKKMGVDKMRIFISLFARVKDFILKIKFYLK